MFVMKRDIEKLESVSKEQTEDISQRSSMRLTTPSRRENEKLPEYCVFCNLKSKYLKGTRTREKLSSCCEFRSDNSITEAATIRKDSRMLAITSDDLIAKEAVYHKSCYSKYTLILYKNTSSETNEGEETFISITNLTYSIIEQDLFELYENPDVRDFSTFVSKVSEALHLKDNINNDSIASAKKNLRRTIDTRFPAFKFINVKQHLYIYPETLEIEFIAKKYIELKNENESLLASTVPTKTVLQAAKAIRSEIQTKEDKIPWPPQPNDLVPQNFHYGELLLCFLKCLLSGNIFEKGSARVERLSMSFAQDLIYATSRGRIKTPKSILFPFIIKSLTNCTELLNIACRLGHGVSYSLISEMTTENAYLIMDQQMNGLILPPGANPETLTLYVADNIDRLEETLSGSNTTHNVNNLIIQSGSFGEMEHNLQPKRKRCRRSFQYSAENTNTTYQPHGQRQGPQQITFPENDESTFLLANQEQLNLAWVLLRNFGLPFHIPSWTGFNIKIESGSLTMKSSIAYLDSINSPATSMSTIYEVMNRSLKIKESLHLQTIVCVFDQAIYAKAIEIKWREPQKFKDCLLMLGTFHLIMMYMSILGKRFKDAGLRDILVQSSVLADGSVDSALTGKMYNRGIRAYKLMYEALMIKLVKRIDCNNNILTEKCKSVSQEELSKDAIESFMDTNEFREFSNRFIDTKNEMKKELPHFWLSFLEMVELLLNIVYATRQGNWCLYLETIRNILPYVFAYDNINYARYLTPMLGEMLNLENTNPEVYHQFLQGHFTATLTDDHSFNRIEADKVIEVTLNKESKTSGGTTGFSKNQSAVNRWEINMSYRAGMRACLYEHLDYQPRSYKHSDLSPSRIKKDIEDRNLILQTIEELFIDPFEALPLLCISNGALVPEQHKGDIKNAYKIGKDKMNAFIEERLSDHHKKNLFDPIKKLKLFKFSDLKKVVKANVNGREIAMKATKELFSKICIIMQTRSIDVQSTFNYPLGPFPWALSGPMGELNKTEKSSMLRHLEGKGNTVAREPNNHTCLIDGMSKVQAAKTSGVTYGEFADQLLQSVLVCGKSASRIDVIFDVYKEISIKNAERIRRSEGNLVFKQILSHQPIKQWQVFLSSSANKTALIEFIVQQWKLGYNLDTIDNKSFYVAYNNICHQLKPTYVESVVDLQSDHEEADTRLLLHASNSASKDAGDIVIHTPDTDVFMISLFVNERLSNNIYFRTGTQERRRCISLQSVRNFIIESINKCGANNKEFIDALLALHALTGCDTVSAFSGKGKILGVNILGNNESYVKVLSKLGEEWLVSESLMKEIEKFVCHLYGDKSCSDINRLRYKMYCIKKSKATIESLPPCFSSLKEHVKRANYQTKTWKSAMKPYINAPSPDGHGWKVGDEITINWMDCKAAPDEILELISCSCKKRCETAKCSCVKSNLKCTDICHVSDCSNKDDVTNVNSDDDVDYDSDVSFNEDV